MKERSFLGILIIVFLVVLLFAPSLGLKLNHVLGGNPKPDASSDQNAKIESLKAELAMLQGVKNEIPYKSANTVRAMVYSNYPFNFKNEILITAGKNDGVAEGQAVIAAPPDSNNGILVGFVEKAFDSTSLVETIFDNRWSSAVRIGTKGNQSLLTGGLDPALTLIPKDASVSEGDSVYSADPKFPYGLAIGEVKDVSITPDRSFQKASLDFPYELGKIQTVLVIKNYDAPKSAKL